jgi:hypothetical protein
MSSSCKQTGMHPPSAADAQTILLRSLEWSAFAAVAALSILPFFLDPHPTKLAPFQRLPIAWLTKASIVVAMLAVVGVRGWADRRVEQRPVLLNALFLLLAIVLTAYHWHMVDRGWFEVREDGDVVRYYYANWQRALYAAVLNHRAESHGENWIPHVYRPLPYGFTRALELWTGDWLFACLAYRCFFTYWFIWGFYRFVRLFHRPPMGLLGLGIYAALYPFSLLSYMGQLTDPMSHAFFALGLLYLVEDRWLPLAASLALGVAAKETAVLLVPAYAACWWWRGQQTYVRTTVLGLVAAATFLVVRLPFGWSGDTQSINGSRLMVAPNLGFGAPVGTAAPLYQNYLQPLLFIGLFLPFVWKHRREVDFRLRALFVTLVPLVFLSSLAFSWLHESRNYVPLLPILVSMARRPVTDKAG